jgi:hypothetical protein
MAYNVDAAMNCAAVDEADGGYTDSITTQADGDLIVSEIFIQGSVWSIAAGASYAERSDMASYFQNEDKVAGAEEVYNATWTPNTTSAYLWFIASFKASP